MAQRRAGEKTATLAPKKDEQGRTLVQTAGDAAALYGAYRVGKHILGKKKKESEKEESVMKAKKGK